MRESELTVGRGTGDDRRSIRDVCEPFFAFAIALRDTSDPGSSESIRRSFERLRARFDMDATRAGLDPDHVQHALFAIVALIDETVARNHAGLLEEWLESPLQLEIFGDNTAGVHFYDRIHEIRGSRSRQRASLLEVYLICLSLGFRGRLIGEAGLDELQSLRSDLSRELLAGQQPGDTLSPHAVRPPTLPDRVLQIPVWAVASLCVVVIAVFYFAVRQSASSDVDELRGRIEAIEER